MGDPADRVYYVQDGELNVAVGSPSGSLKIIHVVRAGATYGEGAAFIPGEPTSPVTVIAAQDSTVWSMSLESFRDCLGDPDFARDLAASMAAKFLSFVQQIEDLSFRSARRRTARLLAALVDEGKGKGHLEIDQDTIADLIGAHRVTVSHALKDLQRTGLVAVGRKRLFVVDPEGLRREASGTDR